MSIRFNQILGLLVLINLSLITTLQAEDEGLEEIIVTGTQIRGANISDALAVSIISAEDIEILGIDSGDELLDLIPENGQNFVNEAENISGGVNASRGDVGAFNLRNVGTGNTLVLINGRRVVNEPSFQTEEVGGSFVPVNSPNSNTVPVFGLERAEVLRDGASAIYGADAVAGVVNTVLKKDFEGLTLRLRHSDYENLPRNDQSITVEWGKFFNGGSTNVSVFANFYQRDRVNSQDDARWANADFRDRIPVGSPWEGDTRFRNDSANNIFGQFDLVTSASAAGLSGLDITDPAGEFEIFPAGDARCSFDINAQVCGDEDGNGTERHNLNENRDLTSELDRTNMFMFINHEFDNGVDSFTEASYYKSDTNLLRHASAPFSAVKLEVGASNYYNPFGPVGSPNRLPDSVIGTDVPAEGLALIIDNYRFTEVPRIVDNESTSIRLLQGFRGEWNDWDWESALTWSEASRDDVTRNRVSNTLMQAALNDPTAAAYNPFSGRQVDSNITQALVDVKRESESDLLMLDAKFSKVDLFEGWAGDIGGLFGFEYREESFNDDRDDRLDGTIAFTDRDGDTFPFVSDVVNSSPTADNSGSRDIVSIFGELQVPLHETLDLQLALRYEDFSDVGDTTVGKVAFGWRPIEQVLVRGSWSQAFRAPNLITINESIVARNNTRTDFACQYAADNGGDPDQDILDCRNSIQRTAQGSKDLQPEESDNISFGIVLEPIEGLTFTLDYWSIEKENTIGLFGEENHTILDLIQRLGNGLTNCAGSSFNPAVNRLDQDDPDQIAIYQAAGICPAGDIAQVNDQYANLSKRTVEGHDIGVYYDFETGIGDFRFKYNGSFMDKFDQEAGGDAALLLAAAQDGTLPASIPVDGFADLIGRDGNQDQKHTVSLIWNNGPFRASVSGSKLGDFYQSSLTLDDGTRYTIPSMTTWNATFDYRTDIAGADTRFRFGVRNLTDERAPLADRFFGYFADAHRDLGRSMYLDVKVDLW